MDKHLKKISIDGQTYYIFTDMPISFDKFSESCEKDYFDVSLYDGKDVFTGKVYAADILNMSLAVGIEKESFYDSLRHCLYSTSSSLFTYHITENNDSTLKFVWKQLLDDEMKFQLGSMLLIREGNPELKTRDVLEFMSEKLKELSDEVTNLSNRNKSLESEKRKMTERLDGYVLTKECIEKDLFTKFSLVLNTKKARIRELKGKMNKDNDISNESITNVHPEVVSGGDTDTDEENERIKDNKKKTIETKAGIKCKKKEEEKLDIILDASIDDDEDDVPKKNRKRPRPNKSNVPVKSTLPRTSSLLKPPRQVSLPEKVREKETSLPEKVREKETTEEDLLDQLMF